jgi:hypothetical protein
VGLPETYFDRLVYKAGSSARILQALERIGALSDWAKVNSHQTLAAIEGAIGAQRDEEGRHVLGSSSLGAKVMSGLERCGYLDPARARRVQEIQAQLSQAAFDPSRDALYNPSYVSAWAGAEVLHQVLSAGEPILDAINDGPRGDPNQDEFFQALIITPQRVISLANREQGASTVTDPALGTSILWLSWNDIAQVDVVPSMAARPYGKVAIRSRVAEGGTICYHPNAARPDGDAAMMRLDQFGCQLGARLIQILKSTR